MRSWRELLIGSPLPTRLTYSERLDKIRALAALSPDALSSIAYANQEIYLGLVVAGSAALNLSLPIALAITALLVILTLSYSQTILTYPSGGGSYTVASENLGRMPGLVAAAALLIACWRRSFCWRLSPSPICAGCVNPERWFRYPFICLSAHICSCWHTA
jgi:hypothetical protein